MPLGIKKETFLLNGSNKQRFIELLVRNYTKAILKLTEFGWWCWFLKTVDKADDNTVVVVEKTLICCAIMPKKADAAFFSLLTNRSQHKFLIHCISKTQSVLGIDCSLQILFIYALTWWDTTSRFYVNGKPATLKSFLEFIYNRQDLHFYKKMPAKNIINTREKALVNV